MLQKLGVTGIANLMLVEGMEIVNFVPPAALAPFVTQIYFFGALDSSDAKIMRMWLSRDNYRDIESFLG